MAKFCASVQQSTCVVANQQPNGLINYEPVDATPLILAGLLAILGLGVLAQFAFQSARFRRRDFAVLRTLGLQRRQLSALMFWQITTVTGLALLIGLPVGAAAGHWAWALFADVLGISPGTDIPDRDRAPADPGRVAGRERRRVVAGLAGPPGSGPQSCSAPNDPRPVYPGGRAGRARFARALAGA